MINYQEYQAVKRRFDKQEAATFKLGYQQDGHIQSFMRAEVPNPARLGYQHETLNMRHNWQLLRDLCDMALTCCDLTDQIEKAEFGKDMGL